MSENTFIRSYKLVPEINRPFLWSSLIALAGSGLRMVGPQLISRGIDNGVLKSDYEYLLQQSFYYFVTLVLLYFVASKALLAIGLVGESYVRSIREKLFRHLSSLDINYFEKNKTGVLVARMTSDMQSLNEFAREGASSVITALLTIFGATVAVFLVDVQLAFLSFFNLATAWNCYKNFPQPCRQSILGCKRMDWPSSFFTSRRNIWSEDNSGLLG